MFTAGYETLGRGEPQLPVCRARPDLCLTAMGFDKDYPKRKDKRKPYRRSKAIDRTCRSHGSCAWCRDGRLHRAKRQEAQAEGQG